MDSETKEFFEYVEAVAEHEEQEPLPCIIRSIAYIFLTRWQLFRLSLLLFWLAIKPG